MMACARILQILTGVIFLGSGIEKMLNIDAFAGVVQYVLASTGQSSTWAMALAATLGGIEALLGLSLLTAWAPRRVAAIAGVAVVLLTIVLVRLWLDPNAPPCRCTAWIRITAHVTDSAPFGIARNAFLMLAVVFIWWAHGRSVQRSARD